MILRAAVATGLWLLSGVVVANKADSPGPVDPVLFQGATSYAPFYAPDPDAGGYAGFDMALFKAIADHAGLDVTYRFTDWNRALADLAAGRADVIPMFVSPARREDYLFTDPILIEHHLLFGYQDAASHRQLVSLAGYRVAAEGGAHALAQLRRMEIDVTLVETDSEAAALRAVAAGRADYALVPTHIGFYNRERLSLGQLTALSPPLLPVVYAYAVHPSRPELVDAINEALIVLQRQGVRRQLEQRWLAPYNPDNPFERPSWGWLMVLAGILMVLLVIWQLRRRGTFGDRARNPDPVAGPELLSRDDFVDRVNNAPARAGQRAIMLIAIDDYAYLQHVVSEATMTDMLANTAACLRRIFPEVLVYLEPNGFAGLVDGDYETVARQLAAIDHDDLTIELGDQYLSMELTAGTASLDEAGGDAAEALRRARLALHEALQQRVPVKLYTAAMEPDVGDMALVNDLKQVVTSRALSWHYQPQYSLRGRRVLGAEMLVRWHHPRLGWISPERFIRLAEQHRLIGLISCQLVDQAALTLQQWRNEGFDGRLAINISPHDLTDDTVISTLIDTFAPFPGQLIIEITETALMQDLDRITANLALIRDAGIWISLDDYGTGYSSMNYLKLFPIDEIKIDRSFVRQLENSERDRKLIEASIRLGHELDMRIVAEGVETGAIMDRLEALGCDIVQGYAIARPMSGMDFLEFARAVSQAGGLDRLAAGSVTQGPS